MARFRQLPAPACPLGLSRVVGQSVSQRMPPGIHGQQRAGGAGHRQTSNLAPQWQRDGAAKLCQSLLPCLGLHKRPGVGTTVLMVQVSGRIHEGYAQTTGPQIHPQGKMCGATSHDNLSPGCQKDRAICRRVLAMAVTSSQGASRSMRPKWP